MTHKRLFALLIALLPVFVSSCSDDDDDDLIGNWVRTSDFDGLARGEASCFSIGNKGYLVCGYDGSKSNARLGDLWEYDMTTDAWTQKAGFPGTARSNGLRDRRQRLFRYRLRRRKQAERLLGIRSGNQYLDTKGRLSRRRTIQRRLLRSLR